MTLPRRIAPGDIPAVLALIRDTFAFMDGRIDPPSSMHRLSESAIADQATRGEVWVIDEAGRIAACVFLTPLADALYVGKLAVANGMRGRGLARCLMERAATSAAERGLDQLELQVRVELVENHAAFAAMGFRQTAATAHPGYDRPTSLTFRKRIS